MTWEASHWQVLKKIKSYAYGYVYFISEGANLLWRPETETYHARALVKKPRIILFDEATSALDNKSQGIITESLNKSKATRIVIAHRLSTVIKADRIYVISGGQIVQEGNYEKLMKEEGPFKDMAKRQLA
jgi:ATP-binding cassette subfamily C protein